MAGEIKKSLLLFTALCWMLTAETRPKIGLVLGGGGAKGAAEVGVLKVIEKAGIPIDYVAGTSIGSIVGGLYAAGYTAAELDTMFCQQEWLSLLTDRRNDLDSEPYKVKDGVTYIFGFPVLGSLQNDDIGGFGMMRGEKIEQMIDSMAHLKGKSEMSNLRIPFRCVAVDFRSAQEVVISKGKLSKAIRASMAIPGVFKPVNLDGKNLVDGGMMNNLPTDVVKEMGADIIIAIDLQQKEQPKKSKEVDLGFIGGVADMFGFGGLLNWVTNRPDKEKHAKNVKLSTIYIHPKLPDMDASSFGNKNSARMIKMGEEEAMKHWDELTELKTKLNND
jgi:NTE family protein